MGGIPTILLTHLYIFRGSYTDRTLRVYYSWGWTSIHLSTSKMGLSHKDSCRPTFSGDFLESTTHDMTPTLVHTIHPSLYPIRRPIGYSDKGPRVCPLPNVYVEGWDEVGTRSWLPLVSLDIGPNEVVRPVPTREGSSRVLRFINRRP